MTRAACGGQPQRGRLTPGGRVRRGANRARGSVRSPSGDRPLSLRRARSGDVAPEGLRTARALPLAARVPWGLLRVLPERPREGKEGDSGERDWKGRAFFQGGTARRHEAAEMAVVDVESCGPSRLNPLFRCSEVPSMLGDISLRFPNQEPGRGAAAAKGGRRVATRARARVASHHVVSCHVMHPIEF